MLRKNMIRRDALKSLLAAGVVPVLMSFGREVSAASEDLLVFDFVGYEIPELHQPYIEKYGASPSISMYADGDEALMKLRGGFKADLVHPGSFDVSRLRDAGLLQPWDVSMLKHWDDLFPTLKNAPGTVADGEHWMIPTDWGYNSVLYRSDLVDIEEESWTLLWDERYAGKIAYGTELYPAIAGAALALGIKDPFHANGDEFMQIREKLVEQRSLLRFYWSDPTSLEQAMASGEVVAAWAWSSSYSALRSQGVPVKYMQNPKEGVSSWIAGFCHLKDAPGKAENAYDYVDAWCAPSTGKWLIENYGYGSSNQKAFESVSSEVLESIGLGMPPNELLANSTPNEPMTPDLHQKFVRMFEEIRAGL